MEAKEAKETEAELRGQADIWRYMLCFADSMALKSAVQLQLADIINSHGSPITLSQIASSIASSSASPNISYLARIMRLLVRRNIFAAHHPSDGGDTLYGLTHSSRWLLRDSDLTLAPMILAELHHWLVDPWHCFAEGVKEGGDIFQKANGHDIWGFASKNPQFNQLFNDAMASTSKVVINAILSVYKDGFNSVGSLADVGGGIGGAVSEIVKAYPHMKGINYDLPHVVSTATAYPGVTHVGGDMFESVPKADAIFMKWILHDWDDKECVRILENCRKAIPEKTGKVIIVEVVLNPEGEGAFDDTRLYFDLLMLAHTNGKERTEKEWKKILEEAGFRRYKLVTLPALTSIIEAYPL
ncbi:xanthohumol 4'-O-methyltransferase-like [Momordica charantia]|uniref:Xanthohumol 4'-O-methyltransferase-like n=1 Tax=Momordica charantia TaxID=3673 RepID=A0A6J1CFN9_MOMCH|nr:xanthohumol 4'-O-methyltransferase-like [Momordica charantia]